MEMLGRIRRMHLRDKVSLHEIAKRIVASVGNGHDFKNLRQFSAWLCLTPGQHNSGGKARLGSITKAGDSYLRTLLVMGQIASDEGDQSQRSRKSLGAEAQG